MIRQSAQDADSQKNVKEVEAEQRSHRQNLEALVARRTHELNQKIKEAAEAEKALKNHLAMMDAFIDTMPAPIFFKDAEGRYQGCNNAFAEAVLGLAKEDIIGHTLFELETVIPPDLARIYHYMNLCTNAAHAMQTDGGRLTVRLFDTSLDGQASGRHHGLQQGNYLALQVADTGHGMNAEIKERIFDPFFTTKPKGEGTGLGLSVLHGIITGSGGAIDVESAPGQGTTFSIYLPFSATAWTKFRPWRQVSPLF